uniref:C2H2-type domain-containing protein n=2 Tax=Parascaris univalens TaxID=6257 RepID=A0A915BV30_PARUN
FKSYTCTLCRKEITSNETLRAHMYKQHQISRMFMCRCCNWAFPDKTSLHMHMQAKEEGKTISVPVIGKGNPPQHQSATTTHGASSTPQTPALHIPQARAPAPNPFAPLQLHALPTHQPLSIADPSALQAAAATLFPQMALLRGAAANTMPADELMSKLRERLMLNNLVAQSGFGLAAWLAGFPKIDQPGLGSMGATNNDIAVSKEEPGADIGDEEDEINVDKEVDEEMPLERDRHNDDDNIIIADEFVNKEVGKEATLHMDERHERDENRGHENEDGLRPSEIRMSNGSTTGNSSSPSSNAMPNLRSAINATPLNGLDYKKRMLVSPPRRNISDALLNIAATQPTLPTTEQSPNGQDNHISPAETNSSISPSTESGRECYECSVYKGKLAVAENRCRYLEGRTATLQSDALRFSTRVSVSENSARQFEREGRVLREQNELLQRKLLECQEKTLTFMQGDQANNPQAVAIYLNDILKTTFLH